MLDSSRRPCGLCGAATRMNDAWRAPARVNRPVCAACIEQWDRAGRRCAECRTEVGGTQHLGVFFVTRGLGHADCGGVRLLAG